MKLQNALFLLALSLCLRCIGVLQTEDASSRNELLLALGLVASGSPGAMGGGTIGPEGGELHSFDGQFAVAIPAGALNESVEFRISAFVPEEGRGPDGAILTTAYEVTPSYAFLRDVRIVLLAPPEERQAVGGGEPIGLHATTTSDVAGLQNITGWQRLDARGEGDRVVFYTRTFSFFAAGVAPPGNQAPRISNFSVDYSGPCAPLPRSVRVRIYDREANPISAYLLSGKPGQTASLAPLAAEGGGWYSAPIPYAALSGVGVQLQVIAYDSVGGAARLPDGGPYRFPQDAGSAALTAAYNQDQDGDGLLCAWEADHGFNDQNASDAAGVPDADGDGIPDNDEAPAPDQLVLVPAEVYLSVGETAPFGVLALASGAPVPLDSASASVSGVNQNGQTTVALAGAALTGLRPGSAVVTVSAGALQATAQVRVFAEKRVSDLQIGVVTNQSIELRWTAPGEAAAGGGVVAYALRYGRNPITSTRSCQAAAPIPNAPLPAAPGVLQSFVVPRLAPQTRYYFCILAYDRSGKSSSWSGTVTAQTAAAADVTAPAPVRALVAAPLDDARVALQWSAGGDDGESGASAAYEVRYSTAPIGDAIRCDGAALASVQTGLSFIVSGLGEATTYYFCVIALDEAGNRSAWSDQVAATTLERNDPPLVWLPPRYFGKPNEALFLENLTIDPDRELCSAAAPAYAWTILSAPAGAVASLDNPALQTPRLTANLPGEYTLRYEISDDAGACLGADQVVSQTVVVELLGALGGSVQFGSPGRDEARAVDVDAAGNIYVLAQVRGSVEGQAYGGGDDIAILKLDAAGRRIWLRQYGSSGFDTAQDLRAAPDGSAIYVTGHTDGVDGLFAGLPHAGGYDIFIIKINSAGDIVERRLAGTAEDESSNAIALDSTPGAQHLNIGGCSRGDLTGALNPPNNNFRLFYMRLNPVDLSVLSTQQTLSDTYTCAYEMDWNAAVGAVAATGIFQSGGVPSSIYTASYAPGFQNPLSIAYFGYTGEGFGVDLMDSGRMYWTGYVNDGDYDLLVGRVGGGEPNAVWRLQNSQYHIGTALRYQAGEFWISGIERPSSQSPVSIGRFDALTPAGSSLDGTTIRLRGILRGAPANSTAHDVEAHPAGVALVAGGVEGALENNFSRGDYDAFVYRYDPLQTPSIEPARSSVWANSACRFLNCSCTIEADCANGAACRLSKNRFVTIGSCGY